MKKAVYCLSIFLATVVSACSPRVSTSIVKKYPPQEPDAPVVVFTNVEEAPSQWEPLGTVVVDDTGFSTRCDSVTVFSLAKDETRKAGGNAFLVTRHLRPSIWGSSCHRIAGTMMLVSDFSQANLQQNLHPKNEPAGATPETITFVQAQPAGSGFQVSGSESQIGGQLPRMALMLDAGYSWRTAKISDELQDFERHVAKQIKSGFIWNGSFAYYINKFIGVGICFNQYASSSEQFAHNINTGREGIYRISDRITYVGPTFAMQMMLGKSDWLFDFNAGFGYIGYKSRQSFIDEKVTVSGASLGLHYDVGLSYKIAPEWAVGLRMHLTNGMLSQANIIDKYGNKTTHKMDEGQYEGLAHIGLSLGLRYYIK